MSFAGIGTGLKNNTLQLARVPNNRKSASTSVCLKSLLSTSNLTVTAGRPRRIRQQTRLNDLQVVVFGEIHDKTPCHWLFVAQIGVDDDAFLVAQGVGHTPRGVAQVAARRGPARAKLAHHARQTFGPVAGSERAA